jgi:hypothetical protein
LWFCFHLGFYTWQTVHVAARQSQKTYDLLNRNAGFWVLALGSIQANSLIALGPIFDTEKRTHNVGRLLQLAEANVSIFSKAAVRRRKNKDMANASHLIDEFISSVHDPTLSDFKRLTSFVDARRKVYARCYKQLRDKVYAHKDRTDISGFVANRTRGNWVGSYRTCGSFTMCSGIGCEMAESLGSVLCGTPLVNR